MELVAHSPGDIYFIENNKPVSLYMLFVPNPSKGARNLDTVFTGCSVQSLPSSIISEWSYLLLCFTAIFLPCLDFCKESSLVEARMECAALDHHILCESTPNISVFMY